MNRRTVRALAALNVALLAALAVAGWTSPRASAQANFNQPQYLMLAGQSPGSTSSTLYIIDTNRNAMMSVRLEPRTKGRRELVPTGVRDVTGDFDVITAMRRAAEQK
ncbi:MAG: hypothetical protein GC159_07980 [Phycisphaera sp.]|nr:hypothetical protein [Phycisphaera sp.]